MGLFNGFGCIALIEFFYFLIKIIFNYFRKHIIHNSVTPSNRAQEETDNNKNDENDASSIPSSVGGTQHVLSSNSYWTNGFWIIVIIATLLVSIIFTVRTVSEWSDIGNQISTSMVTLPISRAKFPSVTVCPPKHSHTALNYDIIRADNIILSEDDREDLLEEALKLLFEAEDDNFGTYLAYFGDEKERARNWYEGYNTIAVPFFAPDGYVQRYYFGTSKLSGSVSSPGFGEVYNQELFSRDMRYEYRIVFAENLDTMKKKYTDTFFVFEINMDIQVSDAVTERVNLYFPKVNTEKYECEHQGSAIFSDVYFENYGGRSFESCKNVTVKNKFSLEKMGEFVTIEFFRIVKKNTVSHYVKQKPMTGICLTWYFEDINGARVEVEYEPLRLNPNNKLIRERELIDNFLFYFRFYMMLQFESWNANNEMWNIIKDEKRLFYSQRVLNKDKKLQACGNDITESERIRDVCRSGVLMSMPCLLGTISSKLAGQWSPSPPNTTDELLQTAFKVFIYSLSCPDLKVQDWIDYFYKPLLRTGSTRTILQELFNIKKKHFQDRDKFTKLSEQLMSLFDTKLNQNWDKKKGLQTRPNKKC